MKNLSHKGIGQTDQLPEHFGTNNRLLKELQEIATYDTAKYFYNLEEQPEFIPINPFIKRVNIITDLNKKLFADSILVKTTSLPKILGIR